MTTEPIEPLCEDDDLEQYAGEEIPDPWADKDQPDWPEQEVVI